MSFETIYGPIKKEIYFLANEEIHSQREGFYYLAKKIWDEKFLNDVLPLEYINYQDPKYKLSLLHIAVINSNLYAMSRLLSNQANPYLEDYRGWTPFHHVELINCIFLEIATDLSNNIDMLIRKSFMTQIGKVNRIFLTHNDITLPCKIFIKNHVSINHIEYSLLTKMVYNEKYSDLKNYFLRNWYNSENSLMRIFPFTLEIIEQLKHINSSSEVILEKFLRTFNEDIFPKHKILGEYTNEKKIEINLYEIQMFDKNNKIQIECGFPNVAMVPIPCIKYDGEMFCRNILVSLEQVQGEFLWNYRQYYPRKLVPYIELRPIEMRKFIQENTIDSLIECTKQAIHECLNWKMYEKAEKFHYIIQNPGALFLLRIEGLITEEDLKKIINFSKNEIFVENKNFIAITNYLVHLKGIFKSIHPILANDFINFFSKLSAIFSLDVVLIRSRFLLQNFKISRNSYLRWILLKDILIQDMDISSHNKNSEIIFSSLSESPKIWGKSHQNLQQYAITGIGKKLDKSDIGKQFVRTCPVQQTEGFDWSFVPCLNDLKLYFITVLNVEDNFIEIKEGTFSHRLSKDYHDNNWIEIHLFEEKVQFLMSMYSIDEIRNFNNNILSTLALDEVKKYNIFENSFYENFSPFSETPKLLGKFQNSKTYAITGIGKKLTSKDVGKKFIRTCPIKKFRHFDWSFTSKVEDVNFFSITILRVEEDYIEIGRKDRTYKLSKNFHDYNWIEADNYKTSVEKVLEMHSSDEIKTFDHLNLIIENLLKQYKRKKLKDNFIDKSQFSSFSKKPKLLGKFNSNTDMYAITGIGRNLTEKDIGKQFVRTCPVLRKLAFYDWSMIPTMGIIEHSRYIFSGYDENSKLIFNNDLKLTKKFNDYNWIEFEKYDESIKKVLEKNQNKNIKFFYQNGKDFKDYS